MRAAAVLLLGSLGGCAPGAPAAAPAAASAAAADAARAEILWDSYGVPHIYAADHEALFHAFGWAQARNHGDRLLRLFGTHRGRAAEYWGEEQWPSDSLYWTAGVPDGAVRAYAALPPELRGYVDAFARGVNDYAAAHPDRIADGVEVVLPIEGRDVMAQALNVSLLFSSAARQAGGWAERPGSNAWAIAPAKSASGNALLLANPHLPWTGAFTFFEAQLTAPGVDAYGASLLGLPMLNIAFNDHLGWTHTVNTQDLEDLFELTLVPGGYRWAGGVRAFETDSVRLRVRDADGALAPRVLVRRRSVHGPVLAERDGRALAWRAVSANWTEALQQEWEMMRARNLAEFERALARHQMVGFNTVYADREGNILYSYGAATPRRRQGDYAFWQGVLPGDDPALVWQGVHPYAEMPRVLNPPSGWLQNANDPPWFAAYPQALSAAAFPPYFAPEGLAFRPQQSLQLLQEAGPVSLEQLVRLKHATEMELGVRLVPELVEAARAHGTADARTAAGVLERWDRRSDADSRGAVLFDAWYEQMRRRAGSDGIFAVPWSSHAPLSTPDGLADPAAAAAALETAARAVRERHGSLDVAWGEVHRLRAGDVDLPANGAPGQLGTFRVTYYAPADDGRQIAVGGDSYVAAIEFSDPVRARALIGYGNASQPGSPHRTDQMRLFSEQRLRPVWRTRAEVEANLAEREVF